LHGVTHRTNDHFGQDESPEEIFLRRSQPGDAVFSCVLIRQFAMPKFYDSIPADLADWAMRQPVFFTASAPLAGRHVNISPKGIPSATLKILSPNSVAYVDATGSGSETIAHIYENGRVTLMFCSFGATPRIMRFFCTGRVVEWDQPEFETLLQEMGKEKVVSARAVIVLDVFKVQTSCGYGVPRISSNISCDVGKASEMAFEDRETIGHWGANKVEKNELLPYQEKNNAYSLDGLTGLRTARRGIGESLWLGDTKARMRRILAPRESVVTGVFLGIMLVLLVQFMAVALNGTGIERVTLGIEV
jgi:hypothetical protein